MAPRNLRKKKPESDDDDEDPHMLQERIDDARVLIKNRAKAKVQDSPNTNGMHARVNEIQRTRPSRSDPSLTTNTHSSIPYPHRVSALKLWPWAMTKRTRLLRSKPKKKRHLRLVCER